MKKENNEIEQLQKLNFDEFVNNYDRVLILILCDIQNATRTKNGFDATDEDLSFIVNYELEEIKIIKSINRYLYRRLYLMLDYAVHSQRINKETFETINNRQKTELDNCQRKRMFLQYRLKKIDESEILERINEFQKIQELELLDYSTTSASEKIIFLEKLGILDFLRSKEPFNENVNAIAKVLSAITGVNTTTIQGYINPIINPIAKQDKNPFKTTKTVDKVNSKLIKIGIKQPD